ELNRVSFRAWDETLEFLANVTIVPYLYMFMMGIILQRNKTALARILHGKGLFWLLAYLLLAVSFETALGIKRGTNLPNIVSMTVLALAVGSLAVTKPGLSEKLLRGNDFSYGLYVYHMIIVNCAIVLGYKNSLPALWVVLLLSYLVAVL